jgi:anti-sigma B factor antagonist
MQAVLESSKIAVIRPQSCLNAANALEFERYLTAALTGNDISILVLDLAAVESLDSDGLMVLVSTLKLAQGLGRRFSLCGVSPAIKIIFELTQLDEVFEIIEGTAELSAV